MQLLALPAKTFDGIRSPRFPNSDEHKLDGEDGRSGTKKALAIAVLAIERQAGPMQPGSDQHDMKLLMDRLASGDDMEHYTRAAWIALTGTLPPAET